MTVQTRKTKPVSKMSLRKINLRKSIVVSSILSAVVARFAAKPGSHGSLLSYWTTALICTNFPMGPNRSNIIF